MRGNNKTETEFSKKNPVSKRLPDRHSWISRMNKAAKICVDLYTNVLIYEATHLGTACGNHEAPVNVLQIFEVKYELQK